MSPKRLVRYDAAHPVQFLSNGTALVKPLDHDSRDVSNKKFVVTSAVVKNDGNGCFETEFSLYIPHQRSA